LIIQRRGWRVTEPSDFGNAIAIAIACILELGAIIAKAASQSKTLVRLNSAKVRRAQKLLGAKTETEAIEQALDLVIAESKGNRLAFEASDRFIKIGAEITDVPASLDR
jgi:hypothetical protein